MRKQSVKIISGWSNPGGSTLHHIALTNLLNANGYDCTFYGPHEWHMDKCKSALINEANPNVHDIVISHFILLNKVNFKKHILSCHETNLFILKHLDLSNVDVIQFVSNSQKKWHSVNHPSVIIPPVVDRINWVNPNNNIAGVIGSIDEHKQTHVSIERALKGGFDKVYLFGQITDKPYFDKMIFPYVVSNQVVVKNHYDNKEEMYNSIEAVYHSSKRETYGLVEAECTLAHIPFSGPSNNQIILEEQDILERWKSLLN